MKRAMCCSFVLACALGGIARAGEDEWRFEVGAYLWATSIDGDAGFGGPTSSVEADFIDVLKSVDSVSGLTLHTEARRGRGGVFSDFNYAKIGVDNIPSPTGELDLTSTTLYLEGGVAYRLIEKDSMALDGLLGARLTAMGTDLAIPGAGNDVEQTNVWVDPFIGARARFDFGEHWTTQVRGDVGGFGVGSQFSWNAIGLLGYRFHTGKLPTTAFVGYHALGQDFRSSGFDWDTIVHGPMLGLSFDF